MNIPEYPLLIEKYLARLALLDRANSENYAADDALAEGQALLAEQHYQQTSAYRRRLAQLESELDALVAELDKYRAFLHPREVAAEAEAEARKRRYGSEKQDRQPYIS